VALRFIQSPIHTSLRRGKKREGKATEGIRRREIREDNRVDAPDERVPSAWPPAAAVDAVTVELRDSQDRRNITSRRGKILDNAAPVSGSRQGCLTTARFLSVPAREKERERQCCAVPQIYLKRVKIL